MTNNLKKFWVNFILSLVTMSSVIFGSSFIANNFIDNNFILKIKSQGLIFDKTILLLKKNNSRLLIKKYIEAVIDSFVEFEEMPSFNDIKYFFELIINSSENNFKIKSFKIYNNKLIITYEFENLETVRRFVKDIKNKKHLDNILYYEYEILDNIYIIKICFFRYNKI